MVEFLTGLYLISGFISIGSYIPNLLTTIREQKTDQSSAAWLLWFVCSFISLLYAIFVNKDPCFIGMMIGHCFGTISMYIVVSRKRNAN